MGTQQFCLRWNNHQTNLLAVFDQLLQNEAFVDVTLACEGLSIKAHKMVLSACSPYFQSLFLDNPCQHPIVILKDMRFSELKAVVDFMYKGEVNVSQDQLSALLKTAETLKVKGLAEVTGSSPTGSGGDITRSTLGVGPPNQGGPPPSSTEGRLSPPSKRKRGRPTKRPSTDGEQLEVVESLVDVVPDGPDSVPPSQERSTEQSSVQGMELLTDAPSISDHAHNTSDLAYDGPTQEQNSRDSSMILADQTQSSSSSLGHLPATASTSGMSPGQALHPETSPETVPVKDEPFENLQVALNAATLSSQPSLQQQQQQQAPPPPLPPLPPSVIDAMPGTSSGTIRRSPGKLDKNLKFRRLFGAKQTSYPCHICSRIYYSPSSLHSHLNVHRSRYKCTFCQNAFTSPYGLECHLQTHIPIKDRLKPYCCPSCRKSFTHRSYLNQHIKKSCKHK